MSEPLPIYAVLPDLLRELSTSSNAVLVAPPGAGKTTAVAPALLNEVWCTGKILLLSPRRLAARAAAERMAQLAGESVGQTIGYVTRMDSKQSPETRILVLTEGIFRNRIQDDPELAGVSAVLFDEVHERSLDTDFGLALALDVQKALRPDLRLLAMSATLDGARFATLMNDAPVIESEGRSWPLDLRYIGRAAERRIEEDMAAAVRRALEEERGDLLAFLPGVAEIERTAERLDSLPRDIVIHPLHGSLDPAAQRATLRTAEPGTRKVILATSIAETSLTIDGVRIVIDSGLARRSRYDRAAGLTRLVTEKASQAAAIQRAGRAARQGAGVAYRLWEAAATSGMPPYDPPAILESDLSALLLDCAQWGLIDPAALQWIDAPSDAAVQEARSRLRSLGALDDEGRITLHGKAISRLPLEPRLAHMLVRAGEMGLGRVAAQVAVLLTERGLGGNDADLSQRLVRWRRESGKRAEAGRRLAKRWEALVARQSRDDGEEAIGICLALAFPDRVSKRRNDNGEDWISVGGRAFRLDPTSPLARETWLAVGEVQGRASGARIISAAPVDEASVVRLFSDRIEEKRTVRFRADTQAVEALRERRLGMIRLASGPDDSPDPVMVATALLEGVRAGGIELLPWSQNARSLRARAAFAGRDELNDKALTARLDEWLPPLLAGQRRLSGVDPSALSGVLEAVLGWDVKQQIDRLAPPEFISPAGSHHAIDYDAEGGPRVELRVQALFGLAEHPCIGSKRIPLVLSLTSPAGRPIQTTRDLPGFWAGSWAAVAKEMRGRYPRHPWPDNPAAASATLRTKRADARAKP